MSGREGYLGLGAYFLAFLAVEQRLPRWRVVCRFVGHDLSVSGCWYKPSPDALAWEAIYPGKPLPPAIIETVFTCVRCGYEERL